MFCYFQALTSKQLLLRNSGEDLSSADLAVLERVKVDIKVMQTSLETFRKQSQEHALIMQDFQHKKEEQLKKLGITIKPSTTVNSETFTLSPRQPAPIQEARYNEDGVMRQPSEPFISKKPVGPISKKGGMVLDTSTGEFRKNEEDSKTIKLSLSGKESEVTSSMDDFNKLRDTLSSTKGVKHTNLETFNHMQRICESKDNPFAEESLSGKESKVKNTDARTTTLSPSFENTSDDERKHFLSNWISLDHFGLMMNQHGKMCQGEIKITESKKKIGFTCKERYYKCTKCLWQYNLLPSPRLLGRGVADFVAGITLHTSGGVVNSLHRGCKQFGFSLPKDNKFQNGAFKKTTLRKVIKAAATKVRAKNIEKALKE